MPISAWSGGRGFVDGPAMPPGASPEGVEPPAGDQCLDEYQADTEGYLHGCRRHSIGAGYIVLVARELTGLSQRRLAERVGTSQPTLAKLETGARIPTVRTLMRVAGAAGFELLLGLREVDADPPSFDALDGIALLGAMLPALVDDLADFVVLREPSVFDGPRD